MTSPSAFLYRYTPGSVGIVRIFDSKSINSTAGAPCAGQSAREREQTYSIGWENSSVCYKKADEPAKHAPPRHSNSDAVSVLHSSVSLGASRSAAAKA